MPLSEKAKKLGQEPAFPYAIREDSEAWSGGMTKREHFTAEAMKGLIASVPTMSRMDAKEDSDSKFIPGSTARYAIQHADALLEALAKEGE